MVQITHTRQRNSDTGAFELVAAMAFDKQTDGKKTCFCPDENCSATLTHYRSYNSTFYDVITNEPFKLKIASHFKKEQGSVPHDISCTAVKHYAAYQNFSRDHGTSFGDGRFVFNLNILTDTIPAPTRQRPPISLQNFNEATLVMREPKETPPRQLSKGLNDVKQLAQLLDRTEFDRQYRDSIALRNGNRYYNLSEIFYDSAVAAFKSHHEMAKKGEHRPALVQFKPIAIGKFHSKANGTIQGLATPIKGVDGQDYSVSMMLHCDDDKIYGDIKKSIRDNKRSFLVYADKSYVNLQEFADKKTAIKGGAAKDNSVLVHFRVKTSQQICAWTPTNGQIELQKAGLDLPDVPAPTKQRMPSSPKTPKDPSQQLNLF